MTLPWFSFYTDDYLGNTMHLTTEEHGAYLLLMLAYYRTEKPLPGYDRALASIAKLPLDRWIVTRVAIEPLFVVDGDVWRHDRIEAEIAERREKHAKSSEKARNAALAKAAKHAPSKHEAAPNHTRVKRERSSSPPHLQEQLTLSRERVNAPEGAEGTLSPKVEVGLARKEESSVVPLNPLGTTLPVDWIPGTLEIACAREYGMDDIAIEAELLKFHARSASRGIFSKNWSAEWQTWCARWKEYKDAEPKRAPPRIDVNASTETFRPTPAHWESALKRWQGSQSGWSRQLGPEPGQIGCRAPVPLLEKYHIDPQTGIFRRPADPLMMPPEEKVL